MVIDEYTELQTLSITTLQAVDLPDFMLVQQDRQRWAWMALLFPVGDQGSIDFFGGHSRPALVDATNQQEPPKGLTQRLFQVKDLQEVLNHSVGRADHYISQCTFSERKRQTAHVHQLTSCWVDLDYHKINPVAAANKKETLLNILKLVTDSGLPAPSAVVSSGRGFYVKWIFDCFVPCAALPRWREVHKRLVKIFEPFNADPSAKDAARILRVVGSINGKNDASVKAIYQGSTCSFEALAGALLVQERLSQIDLEAVKQLTKKYEDDQAKRLTPRPKKWNGKGKTWANLIAQDLPKIIEVLGAGDGMRTRMESVVFLTMNYRMMADLVSSESNFYDQVSELGTRMDADVELLKSAVKNVWDRSQRGETPYRLTKQKIRERLKLDPAIDTAVFAALPWLLDGKNTFTETAKTSAPKKSVDGQRIKLLLDSDMELKEVAALLQISTKTAKKYWLAQ